MHATWGYTVWERGSELLEYTALLHHIGAFLTYTDYQAHAYYLIRHANLLGFDQKEIALMATTALYQRKALPRKTQFAALDTRAQNIVRVLSVFLRLAKHLDRGHTGLVQQAWYALSMPTVSPCTSTPPMIVR